MQRAGYIGPSRSIQDAIDVVKAVLIDHAQVDELPFRAGTGVEINLDLVPQRETGMTSYEIMLSESQERMCAIVTPEKIDDFLAICRKWDVTADVIGEVTDTGRLVIEWHGETIVDVPPRTVAHDGPVYNRPLARPNWQDDLIAATSAALTRPSTAEELRQTILTLAASPNLAAKSWITSQYDRYVLGNTILAQPEDSGMVRVDEESGRGVAVSTDCNGRFAKLDPYNGAKLALAEAFRNVAATGAAPLAVTNCLNFGSPEDPAVMWQFSEAVRGLADGCLELGTPVTGGNVSFYNQTGDVAIHPTPVVGVLGVIEDVSTRTPMGFSRAGDVVLLLGETRDELDGSEWAHVVHGHLGGVPPQVDLAAEKTLAEFLVDVGRTGVLSAAHDLSDGGLLVALAEMAMASGTGAKLEAAPDDTAPQAKAHIGGNQVMGFSSSATAEIEGRDMQMILHVTLFSVNSY